MSSDDRDVDPSEFVERIRRLGDQRDQEDAERVKKLEEELIQGRSERLARRAGLFFLLHGHSTGPWVQLLIFVSNRTSPLHFSRQAIHYAIATLCRRHPQRGTGEGGRHTCTSSESAITGCRP